MYLLTCPHGTIAGVFRLPDGYACEDMQWDSERVKKGFAELLLNGFANRCETTKWVWIRKHFEWNPPENPNQKKAAKKIAGQVPDQCCWKPYFMRDCGEFFGLTKDEIPNPCGTVPEPFLNQEQYQEQEQNKEPSPSAPPTGDLLTEKSEGQKPKQAITFKTFMARCSETGEKAVPDGDPVFAWAEGAGVPFDFLRLAWLEFRSRYGDSSKRYRDWRKVFRNAVRDNWFKLWFCSESGDVCLTNQGRLIQKTHAEAA